METITISPVGVYYKNQSFNSKDKNENTIYYGNSPTNGGLARTKYDAGDATGYLNQELIIVSVIHSSRSNDTYFRNANLLQKFDDEVFEILDNSSSNSGMVKISSSSNSTKGDLKVLYVAKPDKSGWLSDAEMNNAEEEDLIYFTSINELKQEGYTCVGVLYEHRNFKEYVTEYYNYGTSSYLYNRLFGRLYKQLQALFF